MRTRQITGQKLQRAASEQEVVDLVRDYLSGWHPQDLREIPSQCRPGRIRDAEDIADRAYELTKARIASSDHHPLLTEMETLFAQACARLSRLDGDMRRSGDSEPTTNFEP